ncbi:metallophosphatase [Sesbania bispinosa]|nr:metallophosphatase [Sesbania bispinosa]
MCSPIKIFERNRKISLEGASEAEHSSEKATTSKELMEEDKSAEATPITS